MAQKPFGNTPPEDDPDGDGKRFAMNLRFPGQYADKETNLNYNYFRDYDPNTGRYIQSDPIGLQGGINTYSYVGGNPMSKIDPLGLRTGCPTGTKPGEGGVCETDPSEPPDSKVCLTGECAANLPPAKNDCRPLDEIEQDQCEMICGWVAPGPPLPMSKKSLGKNAGSWTVCKLLCKNDSFRRFIVRGQ